MGLERAERRGGLVQDFSSQPDITAVLLFIPLLLLGVLFVFSLIGARARTPVIRAVLRVLAACSGAATLACAVTMVVSLVGAP
jgi:uncharacterized membrane protein required for colicin V production